MGISTIGFFGTLSLGSLVVGAPVPTGVILAAAFYSLCAFVAALSMHRSYPHRVLGLCNVLTLARLMLASVLVAALFAQTAGSWPIFLIAAIAFALDGLDGWLARREGLASAFGARFDMEVDSILALVLALLAYQRGEVGAYVILLGLPRYAFGVAGIFLPWLLRELPMRFSRKVVCVFQITALLAAIAPPFTSPLTDAMVALAAVALIWSFWVDVRWLSRARA